MPVAVRQGQRQDLVGGGEPLLDAAWPPHRLQAEVEREREGRRVAETARHRHRVPAERVPALGAVGPVEGHGEAGLHPRPQRAVAIAERDERLLEERDPVVVHADALAPDAAEAERRPREHVGGAQTARERRGVREGLTGRVGLARPALGVAERQQELSPQRELAVRIEVEGQERALELCDRLLEREPLERVLGCLPRVGDGLARIRAALCGLAEVVRQLDEVRVRIARAARLEDLADARVQPRALARGDAVTERLADDAVRELVAVRAEVHEDARADGFVEEREQRLRGHPAHLSQHDTVELVADDCRRRQRRAASLAERLEPPAYGLADAQRNAELLVHHRRGLEVPTRLQQAHHLLEEERIPARRAMHRRHERPRLDGAAGAGLDEARDVGLGQPPQRQVLAGPREPSEETAHRRRSMHLPVAMGGEDQCGALLQLAREILQQEERRLVRGVEIVQDHEQRTLRGQRGQHRLHRVEEHDAGLLRRLERQVRRPAAGGESGRQLRNELAQVRHDPAGGLQQRGRVARPDGATQHLHPRPVGGRAAALPAASPQHREPPRRGDVRAALPEPRLPDPGLAAQEVEAATAGAGRVERASELRQLALTSDEQAVRRSRGWL